MTDQHVVNLQGVRLTRLPAGRAEGFVWLTFIGTGEAMRFGREPENTWRIKQHVKITWPDGDEAEVPSVGGGGGDGLMFFHLAVRDIGAATVHLAYVGDGVVVDQEELDLPA
jgi:hypothetical protein